MPVLSSWLLTTLLDGSRIEDYTSSFNGHVSSGQNEWTFDGTYNGGYAKTDGREVRIPEGNPYFETGLALIPTPGGPVVRVLSKLPGVKQGVTKLGEEAERVLGVGKILPKPTPGAVVDPAAAIPKPLQMFKT